MGDTYGSIKVAAIQAAPVFLDREATTEKACDLILEAGRNGARFIVFPENFIPAHPVWYDYYIASSPKAGAYAAQLFKNAVAIPSATTRRLGEAAHAANAYVVMGLCEKRPGTLGTMFNSQVYFDPAGRLIGKHQKLVPTVAERLVHTGGHGDTLGTFQTDFGPASALICGENLNPLAIFSLIAQGTRIHAMSWPGYFPPGADTMRSRAQVAAQAFAQMSKAFVVVSCATVTDDMIDKLGIQGEPSEFLREPGHCGGSLVVAPNGSIIAGPMQSEEGILYAQCDLEMAVRANLLHDFSGHYNRADVFQLHVNRNLPLISSGLAARKDLDSGAQPEDESQDAQPSDTTLSTDDPS